MVSSRWSDRRWGRCDTTRTDGTQVGAGEGEGARTGKLVKVGEGAGAGKKIGSKVLNLTDIVSKG